MKRINRINKKRSGFTLVEMLVVISIIGILSAVLTGGYVNSQRSARDATRKLNLKSISDALNSYYADFGQFPSETLIDGIIQADGENEFKVGEIIYIKKMPKEVGKMKEIDYKTSLTNKSFRLFTNLENDDDRDCDDCGTDYPVEDGSCCYGITSSNTSLNGVMP